MDQQSLWAEHDEDKESIYERTESVICPENEDRWIFIGGCYIRIPPESLVDPTLFKVELQGHSADVCPEGCIAVTPKLVCRPEIKFLIPVEIKIPTWCFSVSEEKDVIASVACMNDQCAEIISKVSLRQTKGEISFKTDHLGTFWAHILSLTHDKVKLHLQPYFFHHSDGIFATIFANKGDISKEIVHKMSEDGYARGLLEFGELFVKDGDEITISMTAECIEDDGAFSVVPARKIFAVNQDFIACPCQTIKLEIKPRPSPGQFLEFQYVVAHNGKQTRKEFFLTWPGEKKPPEEPVAHSVMDEED